MFSEFYSRTGIMFTFKNFLPGRAGAHPCNFSFMGDPSSLTLSEMSDKIGDKIGSKSEIQEDIIMCN